MAEAPFPCQSPAREGGECTSNRSILEPSRNQSILLARSRRAFDALAVVLPGPIVIDEGNDCKHKGKARWKGEPVSRAGDAYRHLKHSALYWNAVGQVLMPYAARRQPFQPSAFRPGMLAAVARLASHSQVARVVALGRVNMLQRSGPVV